MMIDIETQKHNFDKHVATFADLGNLKILDFKNPDSIKYRIRFIFEEDWYRLHITGDLGDLVATNFTNMCWDKFDDFVHNPSYFEEKVDTCSRPLHVFDEKAARKTIAERFDDEDFLSLDWRSPSSSIEDIKEDVMDDIFYEFSDSHGISPQGYEVLEELDPDCWEYASDLGKERSGILELYLLAFELARKQVEDKLQPHELKDEGMRCRCTACDAEIEDDIANLVDKKIQYCPVCGVKWVHVPWSGGKYDT